jgi:quinol-cytochrome oxidoreductase complex cytochrome b subunit
MKQRSPVAVFFLPFLTLGIYGLVWYVKTAGEMRSKGANIPTAFLIIIPIVNLYWIWKWCEGVAKVTNNQFSAVASFLVLLFLGPIGMAIVQSHLNRVQ